MLMVLIEEPRFAEVKEAMRASMVESARRGSNIDGWKDMAEADRVMLAENLFHSVNHTFVRWGQSHGASCVPR